MGKITTFVLLLAAAAMTAQTDTTGLQTRTAVPVQKDSKFMFSVSAGPSFRIAKIPNGLSSAEEKYIKELKSGFSYDVSAYYLKDKRTAYFLRYNAYKSTGSFTSDNLLDPNGASGPGSAKDDITITFVGIGGLMQDRGFMPLDKVSFEIALGYIGYVNNMRVLNNYKLSGGNLGISSAINYHFGITRSISVGPSIGFTGGVLKKFKLEGNGISETIKLPNDSAESLYRFDLSLIARVRL